MNLMFVAILLLVVGALVFDYVRERYQRFLDRGNPEAGFTKLQDNVEDSNEWLIYIGKQPN